MAQKVTNFGRFYSALAAMPYDGDREELKREVVRQYTWGRTDSVREMTRREYDACCEGMERLSGRESAREQREDLRKKRSVCLKLMQQLGVDTTDWGRVNEFCENPRVAGKPFAQISRDELMALSRKLRAIQRGGGLQKRENMLSNQNHKL